MKVEKPVQQLVVDVVRGKSRHELLNDEADIIDVHYELGWHRPGRFASESFRQDNGLTSKLTIVWIHLPLDDDGNAVRSKEPMCARLAAA
jgi:AraC-like DNA-binding protein